MVRKGMISRIDNERYLIGKFKPYLPPIASENRNIIVESLHQAFPHIRIAVYESTILNEWANHQINRNVIFVESEKYFMNDVFRFIYRAFPAKAILDPSKQDLSLYEGELVVVTQLISQAPIHPKTSEIKIEKLIVDLHTKDLITEFVSEDEKDVIVEGILRTYPVNAKTVIAYAKRRNNVEVMKKVLANHHFGGLS
jgi:hypothetical protein